MSEFALERGIVTGATSADETLMRRKKQPGTRAHIERAMPLAETHARTDRARTTRSNKKPTRTPSGHPLEHTIRTHRVPFPHPPPGPKP